MKTDQHPNLRRVSASEARRLLAEQRSSGQSIAAFARKNGIPSWSLYNAQALERRRARKASQAGLAEVRIVDAPARPSSKSLVELMLPSGVSIRLSRDFDEVALRRVLGVLGSC